MLAGGYAHCASEAAAAGAARDRRDLLRGGGIERCDRRETPFEPPAPGSQKPLPDASVWHNTVEVANPPSAPLLLARASSALSLDALRQL